MQLIRIVVAGRRTLYRQALAELLRQDESLCVAADAATAREALGACERLSPDILLIDADLFLYAEPPSVTESLEAWAPETRVVVLGTADYSPPAASEITRVSAAECERQAALGLGASAYVRPTVDRSELMRILRCVTARVGHAAGEGCEDLGSGKSRSRPHLRHDITGREREVLALIADGRCNKEIGARLGISTQTVKNHVSHLLEKYALEDRTQLAVHAIQAGIVERSGAADTGEAGQAAGKREST